VCQNIVAFIPPGTKNTRGQHRVLLSTLSTPFTCLRSLFAAIPTAGPVQPSTRTSVGRAVCPWGGGGGSLLCNSVFCFVTADSPGLSNTKLWLQLSARVKALAQVVSGAVPSSRIPNLSKGVGSCLFCCNPFSHLPLYAYYDRSFPWTQRSQ